LARSFFTVLALAVVCVPVLGWVSSVHWGNVGWGTVPEWIGACGLLLIAAGVWKLARNDERTRRSSDARTRSDA
jgi:protein-S-isoprenylcysteine O-methyltransferase Ste14